jgi:predicted NBD/HSP70 family sugar kinase
MSEMTGKNLLKLKKQNEVSIKEVIYKYGPLPRIEIAKRLSLTKPTVSSNVSALIKEGLVAESGNEGNTDERGAGLKPINGVGRRPINIDFVAGSRYVIGAELGPYHTYLCITDIRGNAIKEEELPIAPPNYDEMITGLTEQIGQIIAGSGIQREKILGIGIGLPGFVESGRGVVRSSQRTDWNNKAIAADLAKKTGVPVRIENNVRARAIGEEWFSKEVRPDTFAYFFISKGIACPLVIKNSLLSGGTAGAGEVGHMVVDPDGEICETCGNRGCLEAMASEATVIRRCKEAIREGKAAILSKICKSPDDLQMSEVLQAQEYRDPDICAIMEKAVTYLGITLANIINFISPKLVIVDGYMMKPDKNRNLLSEIVKRNLFGLNFKEVDIEYIPFDRFRGAKGAAALAIKEYLIKI